MVFVSYSGHKSTAHCIDEYGACKWKIYQSDRKITNIFEYLPNNKI